MTGPLRAAALKMGDPHGAALWAGVTVGAAQRGPAADIVRDLAA